MSSDTIENADDNYVERHDELPCGCYVRVCKCGCGEVVHQPCKPHSHDTVAGMESLLMRLAQLDEEDCSVAWGSVEWAEEVGQLVDCAKHVIDELRAEQQQQE